jgi:hypothetical protein
MPHLRTLVERFEGRPFAIVGVDAYDEEEVYREGLKTHKLNWISAFQGATATISELFLVESYPTYLLIDHEGKILVRGGAIDDPDIERAVAAAEAAAK